MGYRNCAYPKVEYPKSTITLLTQYGAVIRIQRWWRYYKNNIKYIN
jgi:hypothetical protein